MAKKQTKPVEESAFDPTTEQPIAVDVLEPVVTYTPAPDDPLLPVRLELPQAVLFALIDQSYPQADYTGAVYYGLIERGGLTPLGHLVLNGIDRIALQHKLNAAWRIEYNRMIGG